VITSSFCTKCTNINKQTSTDYNCAMLM